MLCICTHLKENVNISSYQEEKYAWITQRRSWSCFAFLRTLFEDFRTKRGFDHFLHSIWECSSTVELLRLLSNKNFLLSPCALAPLSQFTRNKLFLKLLNLFSLVIITVSNNESCNIFLVRLKLKSTYVWEKTHYPHADWCTVFIHSLNTMSLYYGIVISAFLWTSVKILIIIWVTGPLEDHSSEKDYSSTFIVDKVALGCFPTWLLVRGETPKLPLDSWVPVPAFSHSSSVFLRSLSPLASVFFPGKWGLLWIPSVVYNQ